MGLVSLVKTWLKLTNVFQLILINCDLLLGVEHTLVRIIKTKPVLMIAEGQTTDDC